MQQSILLDEHLHNLENQSLHYERKKTQSKQVYCLAGVAIFFLALACGGAFYFFGFAKVDSNEPLLGNPQAASNEISLTQQCGRCELNPLIQDYEVCTQCADKLESDLSLVCKEGHFDIKILAAIVDGRPDAKVEANIYNYCQENMEEMTSTCNFNYNDDVLQWIEDVQSEPIVDPFPEEGEEIPEIEEPEEPTEASAEPNVMLQDVRPGMPAYHGRWPGKGYPGQGMGQGGYSHHTMDKFPRNKVFIKYLCIEADEEIQEEVLLGKKRQGCAPDPAAEDGVTPNKDILFCSTGHIANALTTSENQYIRCPESYTRMIVTKAKLGQKNYPTSRSALNGKCGEVSLDNGWEAETEPDQMSLIDDLLTLRCPFSFKSPDFVGDATVEVPAETDPLAPATGEGEIILGKRGRGKGRGRKKNKGMATISYICTK